MKLYAKHSIRDLSSYCSCHCESLGMGASSQQLSDTLDNCLRTRHARVRIQFHQHQLSREWMALVPPSMRWKLSHLERQIFVASEIWTSRRPIFSVFVVVLKLMHCVHSLNNQVPTTELSSQFHATFQFQCSSFSIRVWPSEGNTTAWHQNRQIIKHWKHAWIQRWVLKWLERSPVIFFNHYLSSLCSDVYNQASLNAVFDKTSTHNRLHLYQQSP